MNYPKNRLPIKEYNLHRPRLDAILSEAITFPLVTIVAAHGYGKTFAAASFVQKAPIRLVWMRVSEIDNIPVHFYNNFIQAFHAEFPKQAEALDHLGIPDSLPKYDTFFHILAEGLYSGSQTVCIIDDFELIHNPIIFQAITMFLNINLENCSLVLISRTIPDSSILHCHNLSGMYSITAKDLKFTKEELTQLLQLNNIPYTFQMIQQLDESLEGWPLPLLLAVDQSKRYNRPLQYILPEIMTSNIYYLLDKEYFFNYPEEVQRLLIKLSFLPGFNNNLIKKLADNALKGSVSIATLVETHLFVTYSAGMHLMIFQHTFKSFLQEKQLKISETEKQSLFHTAAATYLEENFLMEAIECYESCQNYEEMLAILAKLTFQRMGLQKPYLDYLMDKLAVFPEDFCETHPLTTYLKANLYLYDLKVEQSLTTLESLRGKLEPPQNDEARQLLGEVYTLLGGIHMMKSSRHFGLYYKKAYEYIPNGTVLKKNMLNVENNRIFSLDSYEKGALEEKEKNIYEGFYYFTKTMNAGQGMDSLFSAEAAVLRLSLEDGEIYAKRALYTAMNHKQHDIVCNSYIVLADIAELKGDYHELCQNIENIETYINDLKITYLYDTIDYTRSLLGFILNDEQLISKWIVAPHTVISTQPMITIGRDKTLYAAHLYSKGQYPALFTFLDWMEEMTLIRGLWVENLYCHLIRAITYEKLGQMEDALDEMWEVYQKTYHNGIIVPYLKCFNDVSSILIYARDLGDARFDSKWIQEVLNKTSIYVKHRAKLLREHTKHNSSKQSIYPTSIPLTKREQEILKALSQGLTRKEIATICHISVNTVKTTLTNIYSKLGAINSADAIHIASENNFI